MEVFWRAAILSARFFIIFLNNLPIFTLSNWEKLTFCTKVCLVFLLLRSFRIVNGWVSEAILKHGITITYVLELKRLRAHQITHCRVALRYCQLRHSAKLTWDQVLRQLEFARRKSLKNQTLWGLEVGGLGCAFLIVGKRACLQISGFLFLIFLFWLLASQIDLIIQLLYIILNLLHIITQIGYTLIIHLHSFLSRASLFQVLVQISS